MKTFCSFCKTNDHNTTECPKLKSTSHGTPRPSQAANNLHQARISLTRAYLLNPKSCPDGLDLPNWKSPHKIWFTGREDHWINLALATQEKTDQEQAVNQPKPRRSPFQPNPTPPPTPASPLATMRANAEVILANIKPATKPPSPDATKPTPVAVHATKPQGGRPAKGNKPMTSTERARIHRAKTNPQNEK